MTTTKRKRPERREPKRRKPAAQRKGEDIHVRVTEAQKDKLRAAAEREGLGVSTWLLACGLRAAEATQREGGAG